MKIGLLTHLSPTHPLLVSDLTEGIQMQLKEEDELINDFLGVNASEAEIKEKAQFMLLKGVDVLVVYSAFLNLQEVQKVADLMNKKVVLIDAGYYENKKPFKSGNSVWLSLQLAEASSCLAQAGNGKNKEQKLGVIADFINSGFMGSYFLTESHLKSGGEICFQQIIPSEQSEEEVLGLTQDLILETEPDLLYINTDKAHGEALLSLLKREAIKSKLPKLKILLGDELLYAMESNSELWNENVMACSTWHRNLPEGRTFQNAFDQSSERKAGIFAALGFEAVAIAQQLLKGELKDFEGARGKLTYDEKKGYFFAALNLIEASNDQISVSPIGDENNIPSIEPLSGWTNAYLCY